MRVGLGEGEAVIVTVERADGISVAPGRAITVSVPDIHPVTIGNKTHIRHNLANRLRDTLDSVFIVFAIRSC